MTKPTPYVSVVTAVLNAAPAIERTIISVLAQTYSQIEYVIVDGCSTDGTLEIIDRYRPHIAKFISQSDNGIYDAFNKGIGLSSGSYIAFINAGDWISPDHIQIAVDLLEANPDKAFVYGDLLLHQLDVPLYLTKGSGDYQRSFRYAMGPLNHPSMVIRRNLFSSIGPFDTRFRISGDFNWLQRLHKAGQNGAYSDKICANMTLDGVSYRFGFLGLRENRVSSLSVGMNPILCWLVYFVFVARLRARTLLERVVPAGMVLFMRERVFRSLTVISKK